MGPSDPFYSSGLVKDHEVKIVDGSADLNWTPVKVGTFSIAVTAEDGTVKRGIADAFGNIGGEVTGVITPAGTLTVAGINEKDVVKVTYKFDNNSVQMDGYDAAGYTNAPAAELQIKSVPVNAETRTMRAYWALTERRQVSRCSDAA